MPNAANEMPVLSGSEKQVAWAEKIRAEKLAVIEQSLAGIRKYADRGNARAQRELPEYEAGLAWARQQAESRFWIDTMRQLSDPAGMAAQSAKRGGTRWLYHAEED